METQLDQSKLVLETLERLKRNKDYQYLCSHLEKIKTRLDNYIFDETVLHEEKKSLIVKSNTIKNFIELTDDLIEEFTPVEEN